MYDKNIGTQKTVNSRSFNKRSSLMGRYILFIKSCGSRRQYVNIYADSDAGAKSKAGKALKKRVRKQCTHPQHQPELFAVREIEVKAWKR